MLIASIAVKNDGVGAYVRGTMALHGVDETKISLATWLDCIYAAFVTAPGEVISSVDKKLILETAKIAPDRSTWGALPEHQRLAPKMRASPQSRPIGPKQVRA